MQWANASPSDKGPWARLLWRFAPALAILLWPWPGVAHSFSAAFAQGCNAIVHLASGAGSQIQFVASQYGPDHPWWLQMSVKNVFTAEAFDVPLDTRTVAYVRIAVFVSLALAWPLWKTRPGIKAMACGAALLVFSIAFTVGIALLQVLGIVHVLALGVFTQSVLSIGILTFVTYPSMAFAIPGLLWVLTLRIAATGTRPDSTTCLGHVTAP